MNHYQALLRIPDFRKLWVGDLLSLLGDGASWIALSWLAVTRGGVAALTVLGVCYFAPIIVGGALAGKVIDQFSRRWLLVIDCVVRGVVMASVPAVALWHSIPIGQLYAVAAVYGVFKILPIGIVPAVLPDLVPEDRLSAAIAMEAVATGAAGLIGPVIGGALIPFIGAPRVLAIDAASYLAFAAMVLSVKNRLPRPSTASAGGASSSQARSWRPVVSFIRGDRVMLVITVAFTSFNIGMGMLIVVQPWLARDRLAGGATILGVLVATLAGAELVGSVVAGAIKPAMRPMLRIGLLQILAGTSLLLLLGANLALVLIGQVVCAVPAALLTVSSQSVRYQRTPEHLRGRTLTLMRTLMLGAVPLGSVIAGPLLAGGHYDSMVVLMALLAGAPGVLSVVFVRNAVVNTPEPFAGHGHSGSTQPGQAAPDFTATELTHG
jgi:MFS family permease